MEFGSVFLTEKSENVALLVVSHGWSKVRGLVKPAVQAALAMHLSARLLVTMQCHSCMPHSAACQHDTPAVGDVVRIASCDC